MKKLPKIIIDKKPKYIKFGEDINFFELFQKIESRFDTCFILESLGEEEKFSRYSLIGFQPSKIISARKNILTINNRKYNVANPYFALKEIMPNQVLAKNYAGGLVGYLSYEAVNYFEPSIDVKVHELFDQFMFGVYDDGIILDKHSHELFYFYYRVNRIEALKRIGRLKINKTNSKLTQMIKPSLVLGVKKESADEKKLDEEIYELRNELYKKKKQIKQTKETKQDKYTKQDKTNHVISKPMTLKQYQQLSKKKKLNKKHLSLNSQGKIYSLINL